jgi:hypothetical protein
MKTTFWDGKLKINLLGHYVYALVDPKDDSVFYIGLAGGDEGKGNNRPDHHLDETKKALEDAKGNHAKLKKEKHRTIADIWRRKQDPKLIIVRRNMNDRREAIHVEAALIEILNHLKPSGIFLTNVQNGHGIDDHSIITEENRSILLAEKVKPTSVIRNVWLFPIKNGLKNYGAAYEAIRGDWRIAKKFRTSEDYAVGLENGISKIVIKIDEWSDKGIRDETKQSFNGRIIHDEEIGMQLFEKDFSDVVKNLGYWQRGNPVKVSFTPSNNFEIIRGRKNG